MDQENIIAELQAKIKALEEQIAKLEAALEYESLPDRVKDARNAQSKLDEALYEDSIKSVMYALREGADVNRMIGRHFPIVYASLYCNIFIKLSISCCKNCVLFYSYTII